MLEWAGGPTDGAAKFLCLVSWTVLPGVKLQLSRKEGKTLYERVSMHACCLTGYDRAIVVLR